MLLPESRYRFNLRKSAQKRPRGLPVLGLVFLFFAAAGIILFATGVFSRLGNFLSSADQREESLEELWEAKSYEALNSRCEEILKEHPLYFDALFYNGIAYFYRGADQFALETKLPLIDKSIKNLRKLLLLDETPLQGKIEYMLGKAYYLKGKFYSDLSLEYLEESMVSGYIGEDTYEYLGLTYSRLGDYQKSAVSYQKVLEKKPSDTLYLVLAQAYYQLDNFLKAEESLLMALDRTKNYTVEEKSRFLLGRIYMAQKEYSKAEDQFRGILEENQSSADAHYYLGDVYEAMGDGVKARYEWRKALEINPYHHGARLQLY